MRLTIYFDGQFWVGVVEEAGETGLRACRHVFGAAPADEDVLEFVNRQMMPLIEQTTTSVQLQLPETRPTNPKRAAREAAKAVRGRGVSTYAQEAMKAEMEARKEAHQEASKAEREQEEERKYLLARIKARERHRGH